MHVVLQKQKLEERQGGTVYALVQEFHQNRKQKVKKGSSSICHRLTDYTKIFKCTGTPNHLSFPNRRQVRAGHRNNLGIHGMEEQNHHTTMVILFFSFFIVSYYISNYVLYSFLKVILYPPTKLLQPYLFCCILIYSMSE